MPAFAPASPSPRSLRREPLSTPGGTLMLSWCVRRCTPEPSQLGHGFAEIVPAPHAAAAAACPAGAEEVAEQVADDVLEVAAEVEARAPRRALLEGGVSEAVVEAPPLRVGEHLVGLRDLLEALLGLVVVLGIAVGMVPEGELAVSFLDVVLARGAGHAEDLVVVAL